MYSIDKIINMLDCVENDKEIQKQGINIGKSVKHFEVFFQPNYPSGKMTWQNCAEIICSKSNEELEPFLNLMFDWTIDLNWPGALSILKRLTYMTGNEKYEKYKNSFFNKLKGKYNEYVIDYFEDYEHENGNIKKDIYNINCDDKNNKVIFDIDKVYEMIDIKNSKEIQKQGIELAKSIEYLDCFLIAFKCENMKNVQRNCAYIICNKSCKELENYMIELFRFIRNLTIPGMSIVYEKLREIKATNNEMFENAKKIALFEANELNDKIWSENIQKL